MSMLQSSFTSQNQSPNRAKRHSLCQDLQQLDDKFDGSDLNISKPDTQSEECNDNSFISPNDNNKLQNQPQLQLGNKSQEAVVEQDQKDQSPKTITLIEDELVSRQTINQSSKLSQYNSTVDNQSFAAFLNIKDTNYSILTKSFEVLFQNVHNLFQDRIKNILHTYLNFFKIKYLQEKSYSSVNLAYVQNNRNHVIYIDCKSISDQIKGKIEKQKSKRVLYTRNLQVLTTKLEKYIKTAQINIQAKASKIREIYSKLTSTVNQMTDLMIPQNRKQKKKQINPQIYSCSFIRTKYLMGKQKAYLSYIAAYLQKILNFISYVCLQLQPKSCLIVKECLSDYVQALSSFTDQKIQSIEDKLKILNKTNCYQQIYKQVSKLLQICIPEAIRPFNHLGTVQEYNQKQLKKVIQGLISQSQSLVYLPVIELEPKDCVYYSKNKANIKWVRVNHQQKYMSEILEQFQVHVVLTLEGLLIIQMLDLQKISEQKMAILKLTQIKLSRKNNQIYITDKGKGMIGFLFSSNSILGSLIFSTNLDAPNNEINTQDTIIQQFISKTKQIMQYKKTNRDKNLGVDS